MPLLSLETNTPASTDNHATLTGLSRLVAELLGKPESYVMVRMQHNPDLIFAGNAEPAALMQLKSLGLPESRTAEFSRALCDFVADAFGIATDRIYIEFSSPQRHLWGWNGGTF